MCRFKSPADLGLVADNKHLSYLGVGCEAQSKAVDGDTRSEVASHRIQSQAHKRKERREQKLGRALKSIMLRR